MITLLKSKYGYKCTGIKLNYDGVCVNKPSKNMRFCEAVNHSFNVPLLLKTSSLSCKGSQRSMGLLESDEVLSNHISNESKISEQTITKALQDIPCFKKPILNIYLGIQDELENSIHPDLFILLIRPKDAMELIKHYIVKTNMLPVIKPYPFISVCGNILVGAIKQNQMCLSFGCPESRKYGGVDDDKVIVGIPYNQCNQLFNQ